MSGGGTSRTAQSNELPTELKPLFSESAAHILETQRANRMDPYLEQHPLQIAQRTGLQQRAAAEVPGLFDLAQRKVTGANIQSSPSFQAANQAYESVIRPTVENSAVMAGLGRSTSLTNALAKSKAQYMTPLIESELAREESGLNREMAGRVGAIQAAEGLGGAEQQTQQAGYSAAQQDMLRRQALAEEALFQPFGLLAPSSISQTSKTSGSSGLFK